MAHELDMTTGQAAVAAVGGPQSMWHKLGFSIVEGMSFDEILRVSRTDFNVMLQPVTGTDPTTGLERKARGHQVLCRTDNGIILDVVGPRFAVTQNRDAIEFFKNWCDVNACTIEVVGALDEGRQFWALAKMNHAWTTGRPVRVATKNGFRDADDVMQDYLLLVLPHQQAKHILVKFVQMRVVCANTLAVALNEMTHQYRLSHTKKFDAAARDEAQVAMGLMQETAVKVETLSRSLAMESVSDSKIAEFLINLLEVQDNLEAATAIVNGDDKADGYPLMARRILRAYSGAPGAQPGTAWGLLNAVTFALDHSGKPDRAAKSSIMGSSLALKTRAVELLTR